MVTLLKCELGLVDVVFLDIGHVNFLKFDVGLVSVLTFDVGLVNVLDCNLIKSFNATDVSVANVFGYKARVQMSHDLQ